MELEHFNYHLPDERIARYPATPRDHCRLMVVDRASGSLAHRCFREVGEYLRPGDLLVLNNSKVLPARLHGEDPAGRRFEVFLLEREPEAGAISWKCLARPGKKVREGVSLRFPGGRQCELSRCAEGGFRVRFAPEPEASWEQWLWETGEMPLPPYLKRPAGAEDRELYQTVYAREAGSVAAPTAGLHFTPELLRRLGDQGVQTAEVTLHVGYGTFAPLPEQNWRAHRLHRERYEIPEATLEALEATRARGGRIIAVGTTSARTLESLPQQGPRGNTELFIQPGHRFRYLDGLITNFHLPKSSLYILVASLLGVDTTRRAYQTAVEREYRFYSYGDAMLIL